MKRLLHLLVFVSVSSASNQQRFVRRVESWGSLFQSVLNLSELGPGVHDLVHELIASGRIRGKEEHQLMYSLNQFHLLIPHTGNGADDSSLAQVQKPVVDAVMAHFDQPERQVTETQRLQELVDNLILGTSMHPTDHTLVRSAIVNVLYMFGLISTIQVDSYPISQPHRELIYHMYRFSSLFNERISIPSIFASLIQFKSEELLFSYMRCLEVKNTTRGDDFLIFLNKQLVHDKLTEFSERRTRSATLEMYLRLCTVCLLDIDNDTNLIPKIYKEIVYSDTFQDSRDYVVKSNVERSLLNAVLLRYELMIVVGRHDPNILSYLLWCLVARKVGHFPDSDIEDLIELNRVIAYIRVMISRPYSNILEIEDTLIQNVGLDLDHANTMLGASGFNSTAAGRVCESRFEGHPESVLHCSYALRIFRRTFELIGSEVVLESGLTRPLFVGSWYLLQLMNSAEFFTSPSCINRSVMTLDAFLIKCDREISEGSQSISEATEAVLESALRAIFEQFAKFDILSGVH